jgi:O-acetyl-ADP-ribose deacetylase (regulator of RNase III)
MTNSIKSYAGIGSRNITSNQSLLLARVGFMLALAGFNCRTGAANGSDTSFEFSVKVAVDFLNSIGKTSNLGDYLSCFLPWNNFNGRSAGEGYIVPFGRRHTDYSSEFHPAWHSLPNSAKSLMGRNACQVLGQDLCIPSKFIACMTPDGAITASETSPRTGGTGTAIRIADKNNIPVFNLTRPDHLARIIAWIESIDKQWKNQFGVSPDSIITESFNNYSGFSNVINDDLVSLADNGHVDMIIHGLSCQNTSGKGFAKSLFDAFPEAMAADRATKKGDKSKLGTYSMAKATRHGKEVIIINAYTQFKYSNEDILSCDYEAMRKVFSQINNDFKGIQAHIPKIGAGLARGCWVTCSQIIKNELKNLPEPILVKFDTSPEPTKINQLQLI